MMVIMGNTNQSERLDVAVVGVGRMGGHHARTYSRLPQARLVAVVDQDADRAGVVADQYGCEAYATVEQLLRAKPNIAAVTVAVPTRDHAAAAGPLLQRGIACLIEKPLAPSVAQAKALADMAVAHHAVLQVGHTERFNPAVRALAAMNITPRFMEIVRVSPMTFRSLDVGVVMDMMIHDLDIVLMLETSPLIGVEAVGMPLLGAHEDIANVHLTFESGCIANLTASRMALRTERRMRLFGDDAYISVDYQQRTGQVIRKSEHAITIDEVRRMIAQGEDISGLDYSQLVKVEELKLDLPQGHDDPLTAQLSSFLEAARTGRQPEVDGAAGYAAVEVAERITAAIRKHQWKGLASSAV